MKKFIVATVFFAQALLLSGCGAAWQSVSYTDDLYSIHNKIEIANRQKAEAELAKAQYEAQQAQYEATLAKVKAEAAMQGYTVTDDSTFNAYDAVLADSYESAYARRLYAFSSPTYRMPSSYYTLRYGDAFHYASAYDPAFYNIMVSGDMVWVEPKYITSMFGSWGGAVALPAYGWYYGWGDPLFYWNRPYRWSYDWYWGWNSPYYWGWGYPNHHHHSHYHPHYRPHRPPMHHKPPQHNRPPHAGSGSVGNTGFHHNRPGMVVGRNPGASKPADRGGNVKPSQPSSGRVSQPAYRGNKPSSNKNNTGSSSYRDSSGSSSYRDSSRSSSSGSSYRPSSPSSSGGGGGYRSPSSGGGNSRGR